MGASSTVQVELLLVNLSSSRRVEEDNTMTEDEITSRLPSLVNDMFDNLACHNAIDLLRGEQTLTGCKTSTESLRHDIERFVRPRDRLLALASVLLKSRAYHLTYPYPASSPSGDGLRLSLVQLPRTAHGKPYLPTRQGACDPTPDTLSVSHQFPFCGAARILPNPHINVTEDFSSYKVGLDIVVKEPVNQSLYDSVDDFLAVFEDSFAPSEWQMVTSATPHCLEEFYLRWAVKEAYTKAIGVGLGFDFKSFEVAFHLPDDHLGRHLVLVQNEQRESYPLPVLPTTLSASIITNDMPHETWLFSFLPLGKEPWGWACVAVGPATPERNVQIDLQVQWTDLDRLVENHTRTTIMSG
jgi:4'-phosphopantetheinyl transferase